MRWTLGVTWATAVVGIVVQAADSTIYHDAETGFTFSQYLAQYEIGSSIAVRIAIPSPITNSTYDVVLQVVAPMDVGWAGIAWGGQMALNPLTVAWANGNNVVVSSRYATGHVAPTTDSSASYTLFKTGTHTNRTHWQYTAKCSGCSSFLGGSSSSTRTTLSATGTNHLAFAYASSKPSNPSSSTSSIPVHDVYGYWNHDFSVAGNAAFASLVSKDK